MKKERDVPTVKCVVLAFCFSILALMSACAAAPAEATETPAEQIAAIEEATEIEEDDMSDAEQEETTVSGETEEPAASAYDTSAQYSAAILTDGDEILGGTYTAEGDDNDHRMAKSIEDSIDFAAKRQVWQRMILKIIRPMLIAMSIWQNSKAVLLRSKAARRKAFSLFAII